MPSSLSPQGDSEDVATMNDPPSAHRSSSSWFFSSPVPQDVLCRHPWGRPLIWGGLFLAFGCCLLLLVNTLFSPIFGSPWSARFWAIPLVLMSLITLLFLFVYRSSWQTFFNTLFISIAFLLWGIDRLLPSGGLTLRLNDVVIVCFVLMATTTIISRLLSLLQMRSEQAPSSFLNDERDSATSNVHQPKKDEHE
jgi:hypothetical protein